MPAPPRSRRSAHPDGTGNVAVYSGRYGPYVQHGKLRATLPKSQEPESLTMEQALELLAAKAAKDAPAKKTTRTSKTKTATTTTKKASSTKTTTTSKKKVAADEAE